MAENGGTPSPAELLRAALEKIVFFEWRLSELSAELAAAHERCAAAQAAVGRAEDAAIDTNILSQHDDARVMSHLPRVRAVDGFDHRYFCHVGVGD